MATNLYFKNVCYHYTIKDLRRFFEVCGVVKYIYIIKDKKGSSRGFGFMSYYTHEDALRAINELNGKLMGRKKVIIMFHISKEERNFFDRMQDAEKNLAFFDEADKSFGLPSNDLFGEIDLGRLGFPVEPGFGPHSSCEISRSNLIGKTDIFDFWSRDGDESSETSTESLPLRLEEDNQNSRCQFPPSTFTDLRSPHPTVGLHPNQSSEPRLSTTSYATARRFNVRQLQSPDFHNPSQNSARSSSRSRDEPVLFEQHQHVRNAGHACQFGSQAYPSSAPTRQAPNSAVHFDYLDSTQQLKYPDYSPHVHTQALQNPRFNSYPKPQVDSIAQLSSPEAMQALVKKTKLMLLMHIDEVAQKTCEMILQTDPALADGLLGGQVDEMPSLAIDAVASALRQLPVASGRSLQSCTGPPGLSHLSQSRI